MANLNGQNPVNILQAAATQFQTLENNYNKLLSGQTGVTNTGNPVTSGTNPPPVSGIIVAGVTVPPQAAAAGFKNLVFHDDFTTSTYSINTSATTGNWFNYEWGTVKATDVTLVPGVTGNATGVITVNNGNLCSIPTYASVPTNGVIKGAYQHGYFECRMKFSPVNPGKGGWPSFWQFGSSTHIAATGTAWTNGLSAECDIFEAYPSSTGFNGCNTLHNWQHGSNAVAGTDLANTDAQNGMISLIGSTQPPAPHDGQFHKLGMLWQGNGVTGTVQFYYDDFLIVHPGNVTTFSIGQGQKISRMETEHMFLIFGGGTNWPISVDFINVWQ